MKRHTSHRVIATCLALSATGIAAAAFASSGPQAGADYHSIQIASSPTVAVLERQFVRYAELPYLRIEKRGGLHVLRAGFWASSDEARSVSAARADLVGNAPLLRIASYRPEAVVRGNWTALAPVEHTQTTSLPASSPRPSPAPQQKPEATTPLTSRVTPAQRRTDDVASKDTVQHAAVDGDLKPFDAEDYALAFDVFLGSGDRERAFRVARQAVASVPDDLAWRRKLARVAEWTQRPSVAWEHWEYLFRYGDRTPETLAAVLRLAPLVGHPEIALEVWEFRLRTDSDAVTDRLGDAQWVDIFNLYESAGKAQQGSAYFERQYRRHGRLQLLEFAARLAENTGDDERALQLYKERAQLRPFSQDATLRATVALLRADRLPEARALMLAQRDEVPAMARDYWTMLANIGFELGDAETAELALRHPGNDERQNAVAWGRLVTLLRQQHPERAADLALELYRRNGDTEQLLNALSIYAERGNHVAQARAFAALSADALTALAGDTRFLLLRAQYYQRIQDNARAWHDLHRALALKPSDDDIVVSVLWFLIDQHRHTELQPLLLRHAARAATTASYWLPYAAAYHALDQYKPALHWYRKALARTPSDTLLLLNYADVLERVRLGGMAARVRRHAWLRLREKFPQPTMQAPLDAQPELLAMARLAILNAPGDPSLGLVRKIVGELRGLSAVPVEGRSDAVSVQEIQEDQQTRDLILGWAITQEQHSNARAWMWLNAARHVGATGVAGARPPLWAEAQTALQLNDTPRMDRLLRKDAAGLPIYNRYDIAYALEDWPLALDIAFKGMTSSDVDEELHDRYRQHAPRHVNYAQLSVARARYGDLDSHGSQYEVRLAIDRRLQMTLAWSQRAQSSDAALLATPPHDRVASVEARWMGHRGDTTAAFFRRSEQEGNSGWRLAQEWAWSSRLNLSGTLERRGESTESLPLRVGGSQDSVRLGFNYVIGKREYVAVGQRLSRFHTQEGDYLGSSHILDLEAGYRIRTEYPDWRARIFATQQDFSHDGAVGAETLTRLAPEVQAAVAGGTLDAVRYFLPEGSTTVGACFGMGENLAGQNLQETYTRAWRHFYDVCTNHNSLNGTGYSGVIGVAGSVSGEDHFSLRLEQTNGGTGAGTLSRILAARYRHYF